MMTGEIMPIKNSTRPAILGYITGMFRMCKLPVIIAIAPINMRHPNNAASTNRKCIYPAILLLCHMLLLLHTPILHMRFGAEMGRMLLSQNHQFFAQSQGL